MRTFRWNAPIIIGAGALVLSVFALAPLPLKAGESGADVTGSIEGRQLGLNELKARLDQKRPGRGHAGARACPVRARRRGNSRLAAPGTGAWSAESSPSRPSATTRAAFAAMSSTRSRSAPISGRSKALPAGSPTAPGLFRGKRGFRCLKSVSPRLPLRAVRRERTRTEPAHRRRKSGSRRSGRARSIPSRKCGSTGADRAVSPPFASAVGNGTKKVKLAPFGLNRRFGIKPFRPAVAAL